MCKSCRAEQITRWAASNPEKRRGIMLRFNQTEKGKHRHIVSTRKYRAEHPEKRRAHSILQEAVAAGRVQRGLCEVCGAEKTHGHHDDYSKPLEVRWLCHKHHMELHRKAS
jgi:predicted Fe-S protein YdhL (DUF1289 family)